MSRASYTDRGWAKRRGLQTLAMRSEGVSQAVSGLENRLRHRSSRSSLFTPAPASGMRAMDAGLHAGADEEHRAGHAVVRSRCWRSAS
jgi:hypothetical protein